MTYDLYIPPLMYYPVSPHHTTPHRHLAQAHTWSNGLGSDKNSSATAIRPELVTYLENKQLSSPEGEFEVLQYIKEGLGLAP